MFFRSLRGSSGYTEDEHLERARRSMGAYIDFIFLIFMKQYAAYIYSIRTPILCILFGCGCLRFRIRLVEIFITYRVNGLTIYDRD